MDIYSIDNRRAVLLPTATPLYWKAAEDAIDMLPADELPRMRDAMQE